MCLKLSFATTHQPLERGISYKKKLRANKVLTILEVGADLICRIQWSPQGPIQRKDSLMMGHI